MTLPLTDLYHTERAKKHLYISLVKRFIKYNLITGPIKHLYAKEIRFNSNINHIKTYLINYFKKAEKINIKTKTLYELFVISPSRASRSGFTT